MGPTLESARWLVTRVYDTLAQGWRWRQCLPTPRLWHVGISFWLALSLQGRVLTVLAWDWEAKSSGSGRSSKAQLPALPGTRRRHLRLAFSLTETNRMCSHFTPKYSWWQKKPFHGAFSALPGGRSRETMSHIWAEIQYRPQIFILHLPVFISTS